MGEVFDEPIIDFQGALNDFTTSLSPDSDDGGGDLSLLNEIDDSINSQSTILELGFNLVLDELRTITGNLDALSLGGQASEEDKDEEKDQPPPGGLGGIGKEFDKLFKGIGKQVKGILGPAALFSEVMDGVLAPLEMLVEPFTVLGELIGSQLIPFITPLSDVLFDIIDPILAVTGAIFNALMPTFQSFMPVIQSLIPVVVSLSELFISLLPSFQPLLPILPFVIDGLLAVTDGLVWLVDGVTSVVTFFSGIGTTITNAFDSVVSFFGELPARIVSFVVEGIDDLGDDLKDLGARIISFINPFD